MSAVDTIETLLQLGVKVRDAVTTANTDLQTFLGSPAFKAIEGDVQTLLDKLGTDQLQQAIVAIQQKKVALQGGQDISKLPADKLLQFFDLLKAENVLVTKQLVAAKGSKQDFLTVLEQDVLPALVSVAKVVIPLLV